MAEARAYTGVVWVVREYTVMVHADNSHDAVERMRDPFAAHVLMREAGPVRRVNAPRGIKRAPHFDGERWAGPAA